MEILFNHLGEANDEEFELKVIENTVRKLKKYPGGYIPSNVKIKDIGAGADWRVVSIEIVATATGLFFAIPALHKKIRESCEEWQRIYNGLNKVLAWLAFSSPVYFPDEYLFLIALFELDSEDNANDFTFLGSHNLPEVNPSLRGLESVVFNFRYYESFESIAVSRAGKVLWRNSTELS